MEKKQTAVQYLQHTYFKRGTLCRTDFKKAIEMEREEKIDFSKKCLDKSLDLDIRTVHSKVEEYYNKTFGGQDEK